ncbi:hypothetical protein FQN57_002090, partial [Myotisia sp. PD_48]
YFIFKPAYAEREVHKSTVSSGQATQINLPTDDPGRTTDDLVPGENLKDNRTSTEAPASWTHSAPAYQSISSGSAVGIYAMEYNADGYGAVLSPPSILHILLKDWSQDWDFDPVGRLTYKMREMGRIHYDREKILLEIGTRRLYSLANAECLARLYEGLMRTCLVYGTGDGIIDVLMQKAREYLDLVRDAIQELEEWDPEEDDFNDGGWDDDEPEKPDEEIDEEDDDDDEAEKKLISNLSDQKKDLLNLLARISKLYTSLIDNRLKPLANSDLHCETISRLDTLIDQAK